ncbi:hypothetical protein PR202_ga27129 [Eleusine coracana subsp. coracana]|uniref:Uncharacterized protein n=1 Tax=Eleusine coracana subsp. coracana TaxID=191504 RepID=A0AAV5DDT0_ELECO|nr:hypothetical protein PR202_ga27129 [Eleusine coracana subsp. coracana]
MAASDLDSPSLRALPRRRNLAAPWTADGLPRCCLARAAASTGRRCCCSYVVPLARQHTLAPQLVESGSEQPAHGGDGGQACRRRRLLQASVGFFSPIL